MICELSIKSVNRKRVSYSTRNTHSLSRIINPFIQERQEKLEAKRLAEEKKAAAAAKKAAEEAEKDRIGQIDPKTWFTIGDHKDKFLTFNDRGLPLTR